MDVLGLDLLNMQPQATTDQRIAALEARVSLLETRITALEAHALPCPLCQPGPDGEHVGAVAQALAQYIRNQGHG